MQRNNPLVGLTFVLEQFWFGLRESESCHLINEMTSNNDQVNYNEDANFFGLFYRVYLIVYIYITYCTHYYYYFTFTFI